MQTGRPRTFSWLAFVLVLVALLPLSWTWVGERYARYKVGPGFMNWYAAMPALLFFAAVVGLPLLAAYVAGRLVGRHGWPGAVPSALLTALVGIILHGAVPVYDSLNYQAGGWDQRVCSYHLRQVSLGLLMYASDHDGLLPPAATPEAMGGVADEYVRTGTFWLCPTEAAPAYATVSERRRVMYDQSREGVTKPSYGLWRELCGESTEWLVDPASTPLVFDAASPCAGPEDAVFRHPELTLGIIRGEPGLNVAFADGHVAWVSESEWRERFGR